MLDAYLYEPTPEEMSSRSLGDLDGRDPDIINHVIRTYVGTHSELNETQLQEAQRLTDEVRKLQNKVSDESLYPEGAAISIVTRIQEADYESAGGSMEDRLGSRLSKFKDGAEVNLDFDNTTSDFNGDFPYAHGDKPADYLEALIPGSAAAEPLLKTKGREAFAEVFVGVWQQILKDTRGEDAYRANGNHVPIREGMPHLYGRLKKADRPATIISANFLPFVQGGLDQHPEFSGTKIHAITHDSIESTAKGAILTDRAQTNPDRGQIFVGDGSSDYEALSARDKVLAYFCLEGSSFHKLCAQEDVVHFTYNTGYDIANKLEELGVIPPNEVQPLYQQIM